MNRKSVSPSDILPLDAYQKIRREKRQEMAALKRHRRIEVGPFATFYFESWDTMWFQIHEMLAIEKGGEAQLADELAAYNPLVPQGSELVATVMIEIDDPVRRKSVLSRLGGVEHRMFIQVGGEKVRGVSEDDVDRTNAEGKASSVQFVHFPFTPAQVAAFRTPGTQVIVGTDHEAYGHMAVMSETMRATLAGDFD